MTIFFGLGVTGRLGNQIMLFSMIKHLENIHNLKIYHSRWKGEDWFQLDEIPITVPDLEIGEIFVDQETYQNDKILQLKGERMPEEKQSNKHRFNSIGSSEDLLSGNFDIAEKTIFHYPRVHLSLLKKNEAALRKMLQFKQPFQKMTEDIRNKLFKKKKLIVIHVRKGDFNLLVDPYFLFVPSFYTNWLNKNFDTESDLYICGQPTASIRAKFARFQPKYLEDILKTEALEGYTDSHLDIIIDHGLMRAADKVLITNSSFSFSACMLSENPAAEFYKPDMNSGRLISFQPWDSFSYDICPFGWKFLKLYFKYRPWFGFAFIYQIILMKLKGQQIRDLSY